MTAGRSTTTTTSVRPTGAGRQSAVASESRPGRQSDGSGTAVAEVAPKVRSEASERTAYVLKIETRLGLDEADQRLKRLLKYALRACGFRCKHVALDREAEAREVVP